MTEFPLERIRPLREQLKAHPIYQAVTNISDLRCFMERHVYSVWDFMSLAKAVQAEIAPSGQPWTPKATPEIQRFVNEIILEEETDQLPDGRYASHFAMYLLAMKEVGATTERVERFVNQVRMRGFEQGLQVEPPASAVHFMNQTFSFLKSGKPHQVAAAFALGREHIIPTMFRSLLAQMQISQEQAPHFYFYLERHIHLDQDHHGPMSMKTLLWLCKDDPKRLREAEEAAIAAVQARIRFWDEVLSELQRAKQAA